VSGAPAALRSWKETRRDRHPICPMRRTRAGRRCASGNRRFREERATNPVRYATVVRPLLRSAVDDPAAELRFISEQAVPLNAPKKSTRRWLRRPLPSTG